MQTQSLQPSRQPIPRLAAVLFGLLFLAVWALRSATLHSAFHPDDSPEIIAASAGLGIPHPPGYPLYTLLGRLAVWALPGGPAFAVNALASLLGCLGVLLGLALVARAFPKPWAGTERLWLLATAIGLAGLPQLWFQGQSAKGGIYTLNLVLTLGAILCMQPPARLAQLRAAWLLVGLGLANHYMSFVLFLPALVWWSWQSRPGLARQGRLWLFALPGMALYLYLPLRALQGPAMNWGDPSSWSRFGNVLLRGQYAGAESGQDLGNALHLARHFGSLWAQQWSHAAWILAAVGAVVLWRQGARWRPLLACMLLHLAVVLAYNHPPKHAPWVINAFFLPTFVLAAPLLSAGALRLSQALGNRPAASGLLAGAAVVLALAMLPARFRELDLHRDYLAYDYGHDLLLLPRPGAAVLASGGNDAFTVWYLQQQHRRRPDLTLIDVPLVSDWYLRQLRPHLPELPANWVTRQQVSEGLMASPQRPLYYTSHNPGDRGIPLGLLSLVPQRGQALALNGLVLFGPWQSLRLRWMADHLSPMDGNREELLAYYPDSARALVDFAIRQRALPLQAPAQALEMKLRAVASISGNKLR